MKNRVQIFTDFDGTITKRDTLEAILDRFSGKEWRKIEDRVTAGKLPEKQALQAEFDFLSCSVDEVLKYIERTAEIDETFMSFADFCLDKGCKLTVLSGGIDIFIENIFSRYGLDHIEYFANSIEVNERKHWKVIPARSPKIKGNCNHCKTYHLRQKKSAGFKTVYIGDGNTDRCPALEADAVFAKGALAAYLTANDVKYYPYERFSNILSKMEELCYSWSE